MAESPKVELVEYVLANVEERIRDQRASIQNLRVRSSYILTANAVVFTFFGGRAIFEDTGGAMQIHLFAGLAALSFFAVFAMCLFIFLPRNGWLFFHSVDGFLEEFVYNDSSEEVVHVKAEIAIMREKHAIHNEKIISNLHSVFFFSAVLVVAQVVFWVLEASKNVEISIV